MAEASRPLLTGAFKRRVCRAGVLLMVVCALPASAQFNRGNRGGGFGCSMGFDETGYFVSPYWAGNPVYDGRITFARIKYRGGFKCGGEGPGWSHDYPRMESNLLHIMRDISTLRPVLKEQPLMVSTLLAWDDPELFKYPVAYVSEAGGWDMDASELKSFKHYVTRGGFVVFDDMGQGGGGDIQNLVYQWTRAFPKARLMELPVDHAVFNSFFKINFDLVQGAYGSPQFFAFFEDNDPKKRLLAVINNNNDLGEYIQHSAEGFNVTPTNESYKLMVNYFIYALTH